MRQALDLVTSWLSRTLFPLAILDSFSSSNAHPLASGKSNMACLLPTVSEPNLISEKFSDTLSL